MRKHLCCIVDAVQPGAAGLVEVVVGGGRQHRELFCKARVSLGRGGELVEDVVVPLLRGLVSDPRLLQQVVLDKCFSPQWPAADIVTFDISLEPPHQQPPSFSPSLIWHLTR